MWCIPTLTAEFIERMEHLLDLYGKPYNPKEPVLCFDEKSKQLLEDTRPVQKTRVGTLRHRDYEYKRGGTQNIFVTVEPKAGYRSVRATKRRTRSDFARELRRVVSLPRYRNVRRIHFVCDNLNTHNEQSLIETFGGRETQRILRRVRFHYTPKHASWLNLAEIEIGVMSKQVARGRIPTSAHLRKQLSAWQRRRNKKHAIIHWTFTKNDARTKLKYKFAKLS